MLLTKLAIATGTADRGICCEDRCGSLLSFRTQAAGPAEYRAKSSEAPKKQRVERSTYLVRIPSRLDGVILFIGTEIENGEKVPPESLITVQVGGERKQFRRLKKGDAVKEGHLLARLDDRSARAQLAIKEAKAIASEYDFRGAEAIAKEAFNKFKQAEEAYAGRFGKTISPGRLSQRRGFTKDKLGFDALIKKEGSKTGQSGTATISNGDRALHEIRSKSQRRHCSHPEAAGRGGTRAQKSGSRTRSHGGRGRRSEHRHQWHRGKKAGRSPSS